MRQWALRGYQSTNVFARGSRDEARINVTPRSRSVILTWVQNNSSLVKWHNIRIAILARIDVVQSDGTAPHHLGRPNSVRLQATELLLHPVGHLELLFERPQRLGAEPALIGRESGLRRRIGREIETPGRRHRGGGGGLGHGELPAAAGAAGDGVPQLRVVGAGPDRCRRTFPPDSGGLRFFMGPILWRSLIGEWFRIQLRTEGIRFGC